MFDSGRSSLSAAAALSICIWSIAGYVRELHAESLAIPRPTRLRAWAEVSPDADCPYLNVFVDSTHEYPEKDKFFPGWRDAEPYRVEFLDSAARSLPAASWRVVANSEEAAFTLKSSGQVHGRAEAFDLTLIFAPTRRTIRQAYVASLTNPRFPLRDTGLFGALIPRFRSSDGELFGALMTFTVVGSQNEAELQDHIDRFLEWTQAQAFEAVAALCDTRRAQPTAEVADEGKGKNLEKLRKELVEEMKRVRREQLREKQKQLRLEVETH
jgi:hypothetical protein